MKSHALTPSMLRIFQRNATADTHVNLARNSAVRTDLSELALNWESFRKIDHTFSHIVSGEMEVTNQKKSGRCWGFAGLNLLRIYLGRKYNLEQFEFSQSYFMFWDKLEKANYFLENILSTLDEKWDSRLLMHLLDEPLEDGGQWDMFVNLIEKYGVVPQTVMPESFQTSQSMRMNRLITRKLREFARDLRESHRQGTSPVELRERKESMLETVYKMLTISIGTPPTSFDWQIRDKDNEFQRFTNQSPTTFIKDHLDINLRDLICLIHAPMVDKKFDELYTVEYLGNVVEGNIVRYVNLEMNTLKKYAVKALKNDDPVWFGCDVGKFFHRDLGVMDMELYAYDLFFGTEFKLDKPGRLEYGDSQMTHAMLFTGVDLDDDGQPIKWRVENSWGDKVGKKGYHIMSDSWFDEYLFEIVIDKKYLLDEVLKIYEKEPVKLSPWDPFGAVAG